ncbi:MAG: hypothetical protein KC729_06175, partial [Candidatus Eisenbacteria bacterium]|nr:hypothetical protein [Candidatus Eisenbacteria bacterium]
TKRAYFRHTLATLAYRAEKVLRDAPDDFANLRISPASRTPLEIVSHLGDLMAWATSQTEGESRWQPQPAQSWDEAVDRFFSELAKLDDAVAAGDFARMRPLEVIFQGPVADALTHVGQVGMLRGVAGLPVRAESYARARIQAGRIGREQSDERSEFDGDASWPTPSR